MLCTSKYLALWRKRSVLVGTTAMVIGALVAFDLAPAPVLYRAALGLDLLIVAALAALFIRLSRTGIIPE